MEKIYTFSKHPDLDEMFDFLEDKLPEKNTLALEAHLLECAACAAALEQMDRAGGPNPENRRLAANFEEIFQDASSPEPQNRSGNGWNTFFRIAAVLLLAINIGWAAWYFGEKSSGIDFTPLPAETVRGDASEGLSLALLAYENENYQDAVSLLRALPDNPQTVEIKLLYLGNALLALDRNEEAIAPLRRLIDNPDWVIYRDRARHDLGIAYLRLGTESE